MSGRLTHRVLAVAVLTLGVAGVAAILVITRSRAFTLAAGLYLLTADLIRAHAWLLSEPLLMTLLLAGLLAFRLWELRRKNGWLVILYVLP